MHLSYICSILLRFLALFTNDKLKNIHTKKEVIHILVQGHSRRCKISSWAACNLKISIIYIYYVMNQNGHQESEQ